MAITGDESLKRDPNNVPAAGGVTNDGNQYIAALRLDAATGRLLVTAIITAGSVDINTNEDIDNNVVSEDNSFTAAESPRVIDLATTLGGNSTRGYMIVKSADLQVEVSSDGTTYSDPFTIPKNSIFNWTGQLSIAKIRLTHTGTNAKYYLNGWR